VNPLTVSEITVRPSGCCIGAEILGVDLSRTLEADVFARILDAFHQHCVICFRAQQLTPEQFAAFSGRFGELEVHHMTEHTLPHLRCVRILSNVVKDGKAIGITNAGMHWHSDLSYKEKPALATLLYAIECPPEGADTQFAGMCAAHDALSPDVKAKLRGLTAVHDRNFRYSQLYPERSPLSAEQVAKVPPVEHPVVRVHPVTRRPALFVAKDVVSRIVGMDENEGRRLIDELEAFATQPQFIYSHKWRPGDVLVWDNRSTLHRATPYERRYRRLLQRTQVTGTVPIAA
jgi:taurine dioxygenase